MKIETLLGIGYWLGAILDFLVAVMALSPALMGVSGFVHPMGIFSAAAVSWGIMLIIANNKPIERRWILLPTILVLGLMTAADIYSMLIRIRPVGFLIPELIVAAVCLPLWTFSYLHAGRREKAAGKKL